MLFGPSGLGKVTMIIIIYIFIYSIHPLYHALCRAHKSVHKFVFQKHYAQKLRPAMGAVFRAFLTVTSNYAHYAHYAQFYNLCLNFKQKWTFEMEKIIVGIDPGQKGGFVFLDKKSVIFREMPLTSDGSIHFEQVLDLLKPFTGAHVFLERAVAFGMGTKSAFNYGRGFAALEIAIKLVRLSCTYVEPGKWTKVMHAGVSADLKPKLKSVIAAERLYPEEMKVIPRARTGKAHDGLVDALLIAGYGMRTITVESGSDLFD